MSDQKIAVSFGQSATADADSLTFAVLGFSQNLDPAGWECKLRFRAVSAYGPEGLTSSVVYVGYLQEIDSRESGDRVALVMAGALVRHWRTQAFAMRWASVWIRRYTRTLAMNAPGVPVCGVARGTRSAEPFLREQTQEAKRSQRGGSEALMAQLSCPISGVPIGSLRYHWPCRRVPRK